MQERIFDTANWNLTFPQQHHHYVHRCRRNIIADHFDERWESSDCGKMCDHCHNPREHKTVDLTKYGEQLLMILGKAASMDQRLTGKFKFTEYVNKI